MKINLLKTIAFWKIFKPFLSNKVQSSESTKFAEGDTLITSKEKIAMKLNYIS